MPASYASTDLISAAKLLRKRPIDAHKGTMGHVLLLAGSYGMLGAAMLAAKACLRSGIGKLTCLTDENCYPILQVLVPEAVFQIGRMPEKIDNQGISVFQAIGIGPGMGMDKNHAALLAEVFAKKIPLVIDADALNTMAENPTLFGLLPQDSILTPHKKEYERLFGADTDPVTAASRYHCIIVLKGANTQIITPEGMIYKNQSGNPGMATAGSGDVLTGLITGLLAQGYGPLDAARLGVYLHGLSGDLAAADTGQEALLASTLLDYIGPAFKALGRASK